MIHVSRELLSVSQIIDDGTQFGAYCTPNSKMTAAIRTFPCVLTGIEVGIYIGIEVGVGTCAVTIRWRCEYSWLRGQDLLQ